MLGVIEQKELLWGLVILAGTLMGLALGWKQLSQKPPADPHPLPQPFTVREKVEFLPVLDFKVFVEYVHKNNHDLAAQLQSQNLMIEDRRQETNERFEKIGDDLREQITSMDHRRSVSVGTLHTQLKSTDMKLSAVEADVKTTQRGVDRLETKMDNLVDRVADKIQDVISNNKPRGK